MLSASMWALETAVLETPRIYQLNKLRDPYSATCVTLTCCQSANPVDEETRNIHTSRLQENGMNLILIEGHIDHQMVPTPGFTKVGGHGDIDSFAEWHGASEVGMDVGRTCSWNSTRIAFIIHIPFAWRRANSKMLCHPKHPTHRKYSPSRRFSKRLSVHRWRVLEVHLCQSGFGLEFSILDNKLLSTWLTQ